MSFFEKKETVENSAKLVGTIASGFTPGPEDVIIGGALVSGGIKKVAGKAAVKCLIKLEKSAQQHHIISRKIEKALREHKTLKGIFNREDPAFIYYAKDYKSHKGYQNWHRDVDKEVTDWLKTHNNAAEQDFRNLIKEIYNRTNVKDRIPDTKIK